MTIEALARIGAQLRLQEIEAERQQLRAFLHEEALVVKDKRSSWTAERRAAHAKTMKAAWRRRRAA